MINPKILFIVFGVITCASVTTLILYDQLEQNTIREQEQNGIPLTDTYDEDFTDDFEIDYTEEFGTECINGSLYYPVDEHGIQKIITDVC